MGRTATRMQLAKRRAREARLGRMDSAAARDDRVETDLTAVVSAWQQYETAQETCRRAEYEAAAAMRRLSDERVLLRDIASRTGLPITECRRLLKLARAAETPECTAADPW